MISGAHQSSEQWVEDEFTPIRQFQGDAVFSEHEKKFKGIVSHSIKDTSLLKETICDALKDNLKCMFATRLLALMRQTIIECSDGNYELESICDCDPIEYGKTFLTCIKLSILRLGKVTVWLKPIIPIENICIDIKTDEQKQLSYLEVSISMVNKFPKVGIVLAVKAILAIARNVSLFMAPKAVGAGQMIQDKQSIDIVLSGADKNNKDAVWTRKTDISDEFHRLWKKNFGESNWRLRMQRDFDQQKIFFVRVGVSPSAIHTMQSILLSKPFVGLQQKDINVTFIGAEPITIEKQAPATIYQASCDQVQGEIFFSISEKFVYYSNLFI